MADPAAAIVLIGFMGAGKSAVGAELASRTGLPIRDLDAIIAETCRMTVAEIFVRFGEESFRDRESEALQQLTAEAAVVVTGGGAVLRSQNLQILRRLGVVVYLTADTETLWRRIEGMGGRPLLQTADPRSTFVKLLREREGLYRSAADLTIDTTGLSVAAVAEAVLRGVNSIPRQRAS